MKRILIVSICLVITACSSTEKQTTPTSFIIDRKLISNYNPIPDGKYARFQPWGREYSRMYLQLGRCENKNILQGKFLERVKVASMVLGKKNYNDIMWAIRDQAQQQQANMKRLPYDLFNEYHGRLDKFACNELEATANQIVFDTLDYGMKWQESIGSRVELNDWPIYSKLASELGEVKYDSDGLVQRDKSGNVILNKS